MNFIMIAVLVLGAIALIAALVLFGVSKKFAVEEDPRLGQVVKSYLVPIVVVVALLDVPVWLPLLSRVQTQVLSKG